MVCSLFLAVFPLQCVGSTKFTAFWAPVFFAVTVDEDRCIAWAVFCIAVNQGMFFSEGLLSCIKS